MSNSSQRITKEQIQNFKINLKIVLKTEFGHNLPTPRYEKIICLEVMNYEIST